MLIMIQMAIKMRLEQIDININDDGVEVKEEKDMVGWLV